MVLKVMNGHGRQYLVESTVGLSIPEIVGEGVLRFMLSEPINWANSARGGILAWRHIE